MYGAICRLLVLDIHQILQKFRILKPAQHKKTNRLTSDRKTSKHCKSRISCCFSARDRNCPSARAHWKPQPCDTKNAISAHKLYIFTNSLKTGTFDACQHSKLQKTGLHKQKPQAVVTRQIMITDIQKKFWVMVLAMKDVASPTTEVSS